MTPSTRLPRDQAAQKLAALEMSAADLDVAIESNAPVSPDLAIEVYGQLAQLLCAQGSLSAASTHARKLDGYLRTALGANNPKSLEARDLTAHILLRTEEYREAIALLDSVADGWRFNGDTNAEANAKFAILDHYRATAQPKLAWQVFIQNIQLFDLSTLPVSTLFVSTVADVAKQLGKDDSWVMLQYWLAQAEDVEWQTDPERLEDNRKHFEAYRCQTGGLSGLLGIYVGAVA